MTKFHTADGDASPQDVCMDEGCTWYGATLDSDGGCRGGRKQSSPSVRLSSCEKPSDVAVHRENAERVAKIRSFLEEAANDSLMLGGMLSGKIRGSKVHRARTNIAEALALLDGIVE